MWGENSCIKLVFSIYECYCKLSQQVIFLFSMLTLGEGELPVPNLWLHQREAQLFAFLRARPGQLSRASKFAAGHRPQPHWWICKHLFHFPVEAAAPAMISAFCLFWEALRLHFHSTESAAEPQHSTSGNFKWVNFPQNSSCQACHMGKNLTHNRTSIQTWDKQPDNRVAAKRKQFNSRLDK